MADIEKVINQLETDHREAEHRGWILVPVSRKVVKDAITLLKEYAVIKETLSNEIHETAKMFRREG